jgi:hypothetical protein
MKIPGLPIGIRLPWILTIPILIVYGIGLGIMWVIDRIIKSGKKPPVA